MNENLSSLPENEGTDPSLTPLVQALAQALSGLSIQLDGEAVGRLVYPTVDSEICREAYNNRYAR